MMVVYAFFILKVCKRDDLDGMDSQTITINKKRYVRNGLWNEQVRNSVIEALMISKYQVILFDRRN